MGDRCKFQVIEGKRDNLDFRRSVHKQLFEIGNTVREVGIRNKVSDDMAVRIALEIERELAQKRADAAYYAGRRSVLFPPPVSRVA